MSAPGEGQDEVHWLRWARAQCQPRHLSGRQPADCGHSSTVTRAGRVVIGNNASSPAGLHRRRHADPADARHPGRRPTGHGRRSGVLTSIRPIGRPRFASFALGAVRGITIPINATVALYATGPTSPAADARRADRSRRTSSDAATLAHLVPHGQPISRPPACSCTNYTVTWRRLGVRLRTSAPRRGGSIVADPGADVSIASYAQTTVLATSPAPAAPSSFRCRGFQSKRRLAGARISGPKVASTSRDNRPHTRPFRMQTRAGMVTPVPGRIYDARHGDDDSPWMPILSGRRVRGRSCVRTNGDYDVKDSAPDLHAQDTYGARRQVAITARRHDLEGTLSQWRRPAGRGCTLSSR